MLAVRAVRGCMGHMTQTTASPHVRREFWREAVTMALYLSLSLLAVLVAVPTQGEDPVGLLILTAIGLLVAHLLAFAISSRLVTKGVFDAEARRIAGAQVAGGVAVIVLVTLPLLLLDAPASLQVAQGLMVALVAGVAYLAARQANVGRGRALLYTAVVVLSVSVVLILKAAVGH